DADLHRTSVFVRWKPAARAEVVVAPEVQHTRHSELGGRQHETATETQRRQGHVRNRIAKSARKAIHATSATVSACKAPILASPRSLRCTNSPRTCAGRAASPGTARRCQQAS